MEVYIEDIRTRERETGEDDGVMFDNAAHSSKKLARPPLVSRSHQSKGKHVTRPIVLLTITVPKHAP